MGSPSGEAVRIALDIRPLQTESGDRGVGRYIRALVGSMHEGPEELVYLDSRWRSPSWKTFASTELQRSVEEGTLSLSRPPRAITIFDQVATPLLCALRAFAVFHSTFYALPRLRPARTRMVLTVHDLIPVLVPGAASAKNTQIFRAIYRSARRADAVIVPSERTAADLHRTIDVPRRRIRVIPMGVGPPFQAGGEDHASIGALRADGRKALLYVGGFDPTKNVPFLLRALRALEDRTAILCIAGETGHEGGRLREEVSRLGLEDRVAWLGRLSEESLASAYRSADLFVSASIYEGFGLPALEAMACGCPVVALESGSVPEILRGAACAVQEARPESFAAAIGRALVEEPLRRRLASAGLARAAELTWERTARATLDLYREVAECPLSDGAQEAGVDLASRRTRGG